VVVGAAPLEEEDLSGLIQLNRDGWYAAREGGWDAIYALLAPLREAILADPLAGFRTSMAAAPASDKAVMDDPAWQRVFVEDATEALRPGAEGWADEGMLFYLPWDFDPQKVECTVAWWHGQHDANSPLSAVRRLLDGVGEVELRVWSGVGHLEAYRRHDEIIGELLARG
jgi:pimeloyl-ACP methyl ester carboxylesterase